MNTLLRGKGAIKQIDFHVPPVVVKGGDEALVLVSKARHVSSSPFTVCEISSFLGVMPGDIVEIAVDVVSLDDGLVLYTRSIHKEDYGIYDAWHNKVMEYSVTGIEVVMTCRVNDVNREDRMEALFEGLVRVEIEQ